MGIQVTANGILVTATGIAIDPACCCVSEYRATDHAAYPVEIDGTPGTQNIVDKTTFLFADQSINEPLRLVNKYMARFVLPIPQGATINSAVMKIQATTPEVGDAAFADQLNFDVNIGCFDKDNVSLFPTTPQDAEAEPRTTATVYWSVPPMQADTFYSTPSIIGPIQEVVDRVGWSSGNALVVICDVDPLFNNPGGDDAPYHRRLFGDKNPPNELTDYPVLEITWTP